MMIGHVFIGDFAGHRVEIGPAALERIVDLRHHVLREGLKREAAIFRGDEDASTLHFGAFMADRNIACASWHLNEFEGRPAWQLRGMASAAEFRRLGIGTALLRFGEAWIKGELGEAPQHPPILQLWCNARTPAIGFYEKQGWRSVSEEFDIPTAGPHRRMSKLLAAP